MPSYSSNKKALGPREMEPKPLSFPSGQGNRIYGSPQATEEQHTIKLQQRASLSPIREQLPPATDNLDGASNCSSELSASVLQEIREKMAHSLEKMRALEEQVKLIPVLHEQIQRLKDERRALQTQLEAKAASPSTGQIFQPYRVSPVSLGSLDKHLKIAKQQKTTGTNTVQTLTRDVGCAAPAIARMDKITATELSTGPSERLFTEADIKRSIELALLKYRRERLSNTSSVGTQITKLMHGTAIVEGPLVKVSVASNTETVDASAQLLAKLRVHKISPLMVQSPAVFVDRGINTDVCLDKEPTAEAKKKISLKSITDFQSQRSRSFNLEDDSRPVVRKKSRETQTPVPVKLNFGAQVAPKCEHKTTQMAQSSTSSVSRTTDTADLIKTRHQTAMTERTARKDQQSTTQDLVKLRDYGINTTKQETTAKPQLRTSAANTDRIETKTIGVTCKVTASVDPADDSKIPRPSALFSPTSQRKFVRQNTFTVTTKGTTKIPSPIKTPEAVEKQICPAEALLR